MRVSGFYSNEAKFGAFREEQQTECPSARKINEISLKGFLTIILHLDCDARKGF